MTTEQLNVRKPRKAEVRVIRLNEGSLATHSFLERGFPVRDGAAVPDAERDLAKIVVRERHRDMKRFSVGFVSGFGMKSGAIASSVAHDAHNFVAAGMDDLSIVTALNFLGEKGGGLVVTSGADVRGFLPLPVAGLMSTLDAVSVAQALDSIEEKAGELGIAIPHPFMTLSFLCLSVIPELKITDQGYVDITRGGVQSLFASPGFR
jgi:adenine deaminase